MGPDKKLKYGKLLKYFPASKRGYAILNSEKKHLKKIKFINVFAVNK
jgi:hypothetical protein